MEAGSAATGSMYTNSGWRTPCVIASREWTCSRSHMVGGVCVCVCVCARVAAACSLPSFAVCSSSSSPCVLERCTHSSARGCAHARGTGSSSYGSRSSIRKYVPCSSRTSTHPTPSTSAVSAVPAAASATSHSLEMAAPTGTLRSCSRPRTPSRWSEPSRLPSTAPPPPPGKPCQKAQLLMPPAVREYIAAAWIAISSWPSSAASLLASHGSSKPPGSTSSSPDGVPMGEGGRRISRCIGSTKALPSCDAIKSPASSWRCMAATPLSGPLNHRICRTSGGVPSVPSSAAASSRSVLEEVASAMKWSPAATCKIDAARTSTTESISASGAARNRSKSRRFGGGGGGFRGGGIAAEPGSVAFRPRPNARAARVFEEGSDGTAPRLNRLREYKTS
eukprot:scaffold34822_cov66-Phaeocystis_antarctica.AAC.5